MFEETFFLFNDQLRNEGHNLYSVFDMFFQATFFRSSTFSVVKNGLMQNKIIPIRHLSDDEYKRYNVEWIIYYHVNDATPF
jgi:hypothetical protein